MSQANVRSISFLIFSESQDKQEREEEERKTRIQLYVFVSRCISYPFNAKQPLDLPKRQLKVTKQQLETISSRFQVIRFVEQHLSFSASSGKTRFLLFIRSRIVAIVDSR